MMAKKRNSRLLSNKEKKKAKKNKLSRVLPLPRTLDSKRLKLQKIQPENKTRMEQLNVFR